VTARDAATLMFVGTGILAGLAAITFLQSSILSVIFMTDGNGTSAVFRALTLLPSAALGWLGLRLVRDRARHVSLLFPGSVQPGPVASRADAQLIGVTLIGLFVLVRAIPGFAQWLIELGGVLAARTGPFGADGGSRVPWLGGFVYATLDLAVGVLLLKKRHEVRRYLFDGPDDAGTTSDPEATNEA
jgi:hypothetical protein